MATSTKFVRATTTHTREGARGACPGGDVYTTVVTSIVTISTGARYVEVATYVNPTEPRGKYYGQRIGCDWTPVFQG